jgi:hypothetical protein
LRRAIRKTTVADRLLLILLVAASVSGIFMVREAVPESAMVLVEIDGKPVFTAPLSSDRTIRLQSVYGPVDVEIRHMKVRISDVHCSNRLCMKEGWISRGVIVCVPNRLVVQVGNRGTILKKDLDAVTG